jgi:hypothetical protein
MYTSGEMYAHQAVEEEAVVERQAGIVEGERLRTIARGINHRLRNALSGELIIA